jgi:helicase
VVSATATGKTLVGEICGIENILRNRGKMLFMVPLVALANQKYDQFTNKYGKLGLTTAIKVGKGRIKKVIDSHPASFGYSFGMPHHHIGQ